VHIKEQRLVRLSDIHRGYLQRWLR
jgi:hypothetical protein